jgi:hypothetical protein
MSKVLRELTSEIPTVTIVIGRRRGKVISRKRRHPSAPSRRAASIGSLGMTWSPIKKRSTLTPTACQVEATIIATVLILTSSRQSGWMSINQERATESNPSASSAPLRAPSRTRMNAQRVAIAVPERA